jgi:acetylornithine aminotransferase
MNHILRCHEIVKTDFVRAQGCYLYDSCGKRYTDFEAGIWVTALGHNHPRMLQALQRQMEQVIHLGTRFPSYLAEEAAVALLGVLGLEKGKCLFLNTGSEAVEFGVQMIRRLTNRPLLMTLADSFLASYGSAGQKKPEEWHIFDWKECASCARLEPCDPCCTSLQQVPFESIGGFVFEPGNATGQVKLPPKKIVQALVDGVRRHNGLIMANEVTTGFGRTGAWFGFQHYDLRPDIVSMGKAIGNGYPVSPVAMTRDLADRLETGGFRYAQSHENDPLGCAVAKEVLVVLKEENLIERSHKIGTYFLKQLKGLADRHPGIKEIRARGLMIAIVLEATGAHAISATQVCQQLLEKGFIVGYNPIVNLLRFYPPLVIAEEDITDLLSALESILDS